MKGKRGELEFAHLLKGLGIDARRTQQYSGTAGTSDVLSSLAGVHWEVKRYSRIASLRFLEQAEADCLPSQIPVVAMREDRGPWTIQLRADQMLKLAEQIASVRET